MSDHHCGHPHRTCDHCEAITKKQLALLRAPIFIDPRNSAYMLGVSWDWCVRHAASLRVPILSQGVGPRLSATVLRAALERVHSTVPHGERVLYRLRTILLRVTNRTRLDYLRNARWWELEAQRGYSSAWRSRIYAQTLRWAAELSRLHGDGTFLELLERSGSKHPYPNGLPDDDPSQPRAKRSDQGHADLPVGWRTLSFASRRELMGRANIPPDGGIVAGQR